MRTTPLIAALGAVALTIGSCSGDDADQLQAENEELTAEVEALRADQDLAASRHSASSTTIAAVEAILADPESFGTETEIAAAIADLATPEAQIEDDVLGSIDLRTGYYDTLFGGEADAVIDVYDHLLSQDGSQGGSLWIWRGTNAVGNPFELVGISLLDFDDDGKITHELVTYPNPDEYVVEAFEGAGTAPLSIATDPTAPPSSQARPFSFAADALCTWLTEDDLTATITAAYTWDGEVTNPTATEGWVLVVAHRR
jgi:hypothetical protein